MKSIHKFEIPVHDSDHRMDLPIGAQILSVGTQMKLKEVEEGIFLWALVDTEQPTEEISVRVVGTGHLFPSDADPDKFIGTVHFRTQPLVFHLFEVRRG